MLLPAPLDPVAVAAGDDGGRQSDGEEGEEGHARRVVHRHAELVVVVILLGALWLVEMDSELLFDFVE